MADETDKKAPREGGNMISLGSAAALLMVSDHWIRDLSKKGYIPKPERGMVPLVAAVQGYIRWLKDEDRRASKTAAASAVQQARAKEIEMRIAREAGELIEMPSIEAVFADVIGSFRARLAGVAAASTRDLALRAVIDGNIESALAEAREDFDKRAAELRAPAKRRRK